MSLHPRVFGIQQKVVVRLEDFSLRPFVIICLFILASFVTFFSQNAMKEKLIDLNLLYGTKCCLAQQGIKLYSA